MSRGLLLLSCSLIVGCSGNAGTAAPPPDIVLTVNLVGPGAVNSPQGIDCPSTCSKSFAPGTPIQLYVASGNFLGWAGDCTGVATACNVRLRTGAVTARFSSTPVGVTITPATASLNLGSSQPFQAQVAGNADPRVQWSVSEGTAGGAVVQSFPFSFAQTGVYTSPLVAGTYHVVAQSVADPTKSATAVVTVAVPQVTISVEPSSASLVFGDSLPFSVTVGNAVDRAVEWSVSEGDAGGSVSAAGVYTAPQTAGTFHVVARSHADPSKSVMATLTARPFVPQAVTYQIGIDHAGRMAFPSPLVFPAAPAWSVTLPAATSYPLIAGGKVFVTVGGTADGSRSGTSLYALDAATGAIVWGPISNDASLNEGNPAYDAGKIYVVNFDGVLTQYDAETGAPGFSIQLGQSFFDAPPVAADGMVYVGGGDENVFAVSEATGKIVWSSGVINGDMSSPALSPGSLFVSYPGRHYGIARDSGAKLWADGFSSTGGGGWTPAYRAGRVYIRDSGEFVGNGMIFDAASGTRIRSFVSAYIPAVGDHALLCLANGQLQATDLASGAPLWSFSGDGQLSSAPIVINGAVIAGSQSGALYALDEATGAVLWTTTAPAGIPSPNEFGVSTKTGLGAGEGLLVVPAGNTLTAWKLQ
jgi:outer membrane protein assembly factor BamB